jgi:hypothetical protein
VARRKKQRGKGRPCPQAASCPAVRDRDVLRRQVKRLEGQVAQLKARVETERRKLFKANKAKDDGEEDTAAATKGKKKRGPPTGHRGWHRPVPKKIDRTVEVDRPVECPHCGSHKLKPTDKPVQIGRAHV